MPHKKRMKKNHILVKKILHDSESSLLDKKKGKKSFERVPRRDDHPNDRRIEARILNDDDESDDDRKKKRVQLKKHINEELQTTKAVIPKKSRRNKYFLINHPELKDVIENLPKTKKRKREVEEEEEMKEEPAVKKVAEESQPSICDKLVSHMITSRFRYLNEKLYTSTSTDAKKLFEKDPQSFYAYHQGYSVSFILRPMYSYSPLSRQVWLVGQINHSTISLPIFVNVHPI